jgi:hypothetical protein
VKPLLIALAVLIAASGCSDTIRVRTYPPGAIITVNDGEMCAPTPCDLHMRAPGTLRYRVRKDGYVPAEGTLDASVSPGRVIGAILTLGISAIGGSIFYYPADSVISVRPAFEPSDELRSIGALGRCRVEGQAFTKTVGGQLRYAAGNTIAIRPDTMYVRDGLYFRTYRPTPGVNVLTSYPSLDFLDAYTRTTTGDADGRFLFEDLPPGRYALTATITWHERDDDELVEQRAEVFGTTEVREGEIARVIVTDWYPPEFLPDDGRRVR